MSTKEAETVWRDLSVPTDAEAALLTKWGRRTLFRKFGKSGRPQGRKAVKK